MGKCLKAETAADQKLQADMDKNDKDYFIPNFGVDHDIITTQNNYKKAGGKLAQQESVPACNSHTHPGCKDAGTSAPEHLAPLWKTDVQVDDLLQLESDPICNSSGCDQYLHPKKKDAHPVNYPVPD